MPNFSYHCIFSLVRPDSSPNIWSDEDERNEAKRENVHQKALAKRKLQNAMNAENADKFLRPLENYIGVFTPTKLREGKIVSYPASVLVLTDDHWISFYLTKRKVEIMDSMGYLAKDEISDDLRAFITAHATAKDIITTPPLQPPDSDLCALFAIAFLYFRSFGCGTLCDFCRFFRPDLLYNSSVIKNIFRVIRKINN